MIPNKETQIPRVENISCILPETEQLGGLFLGNVYGAQNAEILKEYGIRAVITTSAETKISHNFEDIPFHLSFEAHDKEDYYISEHINDCIHFIEQNRKFTNVFVHCYAGVSRSSAVICAYLMYKFRWNLNKTLAFITFKRIVAKPNDGFIQQLRDVERKLNINSQTNISSNSSRAQMILNPNGNGSLNVSSGQQQRPGSSRQIPLVEKAQSPPLNKMMSQQLAASPQVKSQSHTHEAYQTNEMQYQEPSRNLNTSQNISEKSTYRQGMGHNDVPIPRILSRKSQYSRKSEAEEQSATKKSIYNDYMLSPNSKPNSPRYGYPPKQSFGKSTSGSNFQSTRPSQGSVYDNYSETTVYSTNYSKRESQGQQKSKSASRCLIRPRDLPGYKNY